MSDQSGSSEVVVVGIPGKIGWQLQLLAGFVSLVLGALLAFHPSGSLNVVCIFIGICLLMGAIGHFLRALDKSETHRTWLVIAGLLQVVIAVVVFKHLDASQALLGLLIGISWIVQGIVLFMAGVIGDNGHSRGWTIFFGLVSLAAGIVVCAVPLKSIHALAVLTGIWFMVLGVIEIIGGFVYRSELNKLTK